MHKPENVATPATAATTFVPASVPVLGFVPIATVMFPVNPVAVFPCASCAVTCTAGVITAPATVVVGWTLNTSAVAVPAVMLNAGVITAPAAVVLGGTENTSWVAVPAVMLNAALVALPAPVAVSV